MKTAILIGATGLTGSILLKIILDGNEYSKVVIFVRRDTNIRHPKLEQHIIDFDNFESYTDLIKGDDLYCCLGTTIKKAGSQKAFSKIDMEYPVLFAQAGQQNGVKSFSIISSIGSNSKSSNFYLRTKGLCEDSICEIPYESIFVYRPSILDGNRLESRIGEKLGLYLIRILSFLLIGKLRKYKAIKVERLAKAMYNNAQRNISGINIYESDMI